MNAGLVLLICLPLMVANGFYWSPIIALTDSVADNSTNTDPSLLYDGKQQKQKIILLYN